MSAGYDRRMDHSRDHVISIVLSEQEWQAFVRLHPQPVAWLRHRIQEAVAAVGDRERVIASTDCGFGTFAGREYVVSAVAWKKLEALRLDLANRYGFTVAAPSARSDTN